MILTAKSLSWYHDQREFEQGRRPLGVIYMHAIYHCVPAKTLKPTDDLNIGTCAWKKKDTDKEGKREFIFGAENQQQRDEWISCIEYLRTKAIYDTFVAKYCHVAFPLNRKDEEFEGDNQKEDLMKQLNDFGYKFKSQARFYHSSPGGEESSIYGINKPKRITSALNVSRGGGGGVGGGSSFIANNNMSSIQELSAIQNENAKQELATKIKRLYNVCMASFVSHVSHNSNKAANHVSQRFDSLKRLPEALRHSQMINQMNEEMLEQQQHLNENSRLPSFLQNAAANHSVSGGEVEDVSPLGKVAQKNIRRKSEIGGGIKGLLKPGNEDSQMVRFIEDMGSAGTSPPPKGRDDSNGGFSSDQPQLPPLLNANTSKMKPNQNLLTQRKSSISNFTAKSQPQPTTQQSQFHTTNSDLSAPVPQPSDHIEEQPNPKQELNLKSRVSVQIEKMNQMQKQRTLTFQKEEQHSPAVGVMEKIEEEHENEQRKGSGNSEQNKLGVRQQKHQQREMDKMERDKKKKHDTKSKKQQQQQYEESSSSEDNEEEKGMNQLSDEDRGTGEFYQNEMPKKKKNEKLHAVAKQDKSTTVQPISKEVKTSNIPEQIVLPSSQANIPNQSLPNISELISQTIKEQVSKGIQEILQSVTQLSQQQVRSQAPPSPYSKRSLNNSIFPQNQHYQETPRDVLQLQSLQSSRSSVQDYQQSDYKHRLRLKYQSNSGGNGGASSSKRLVMEQPLSKGSTKSLNMSKANVHHKREREMIFTEVKEHDDEEDLIQSPEVSNDDEDMTNVKESAPAKRNRLQSMDENDNSRREPIQLDYKNRSRDKSANILPTGHQEQRRQQQKQYSSAQEAEIKLPQKVSKPRLERNSEQMSPTGPAMMNNNSQQFPPQILYQNQLPLNPYQQPYYGFQGSHPQYPPSGYPAGISQYDHPYAGFPPMFHPSQMQSPLIAGGALQDNDSMFNFDDFPSYLGQQQQQPMQRIHHSDLSSMFADHSTGPAEILQMQQSEDQKQWAIAMEDVQSIPQNRGTTRGGSDQLMQLYEGDKVEVLRIIDSQSTPSQYMNQQRPSNLSLVECKFENLIGLFPLSALKLLKRPNAQHQQSTFQKQQSMPSDSLLKAQQMLLQRTANSPSPIPHQNQQQQFFQYQQAYNQQLQLQEKKSKLKLNERKKQKLSRD